jgi:hypothetical protein
MPTTIPRLTAPSIERDITGSFDTQTAETAETQGGIAARQMDKLGAAGQAAGAAAQDIATKMRDQEDLQKVLDAEIALKQYTLADQNSAREVRGGSARGLTSARGEAWKEKRGEVEGTLTPRQRALFSSRAEQIGLQHTDAMARHEYEQNRAALVDTVQSNLNTSIELAAANLDDNGKLLQARDDIFTQLDVAAKMDGWSPEKLKAEQGNWLTRQHVTVVEGLAEKNPDRAAAYYKSMKSDINGTARVRLEKILDVADTRAKVQEAVGAVMALEMNETDGLAFIRENYSGKLEDEIIQDFKIQHNEKQEVVKRVPIEANNTAWKTYNVTNSLKSIPPQVWADMNGEDQRQMLDYDKARKTGKPKQTDWAVYDKLLGMANSTDDKERNRFYDPRSTYLPAFAPFLEDGRMTELIQLQKTLGEGKGTKDILTLSQQLDTTFEQLGWGGKENDKKRGEMRAYVNEALIRTRDTLGRDLGEKDRQAIIDDAMRQGRTKGWFGRQKETREFELKSADEANEYTPPQEKLDRLAALMSKKGTIYSGSDPEVLAKYREILINDMRRRGKIK